MYTIEQAQAALHQKELEDMHKQHLLRLHEFARENTTVYNLPYRVLFEYYKADRDRREVDINKYYPYPGIPIEYKPPFCHYTDLGYTGEEWARLIFTPVGDMDADGKRQTILDIPTEIEQQVIQWQQAKVRERTGKTYTHIWNLNTEQGRERWLYYFAVFLLPYADCVSDWNCFDIYGDTEHTPQEVAERKRYYMGLIDRCMKNPDIYKHEVAYKDITDYDKYDLDRYDFIGYMWYDDLMGTPPQYDTALALEIMYKERQRCKELCEDYDLDSRESYTMAYRINAIIEELERERQQAG